MTLRGFLARLRTTWKRIRGWRRIRFTGGGVIFTLGASAVGFAAVNTGNNLLHLLLGATLGLIAVSGWFSERTIRDVEVLRETPHGVTVGQEVRIQYRVRSGGRFGVVALEIFEEGLPERAFLPRLEPGVEGVARSYHRFPRRGVYPLSTVTLSTGFPFGLFVKERDLEVPGELVIWPRTDRSVRLPASAGRPTNLRSMLAAGGPGVRGEYRALHEYRAGADARDIHWKSSARLLTPVVREYEAEVSEELWICLDNRGRPGDEAEALIEIAASLAASAAQQGRSFGVVADGRVIPPAGGPGHLEVVLDLLARIEFRADAPAPTPPDGSTRPLLVSRKGDDSRFTDRYTARGAWARPRA